MLTLSRVLVAGPIGRWRHGFGYDLYGLDGRGGRRIDGGTRRLRRRGLDALGGGSGLLRHDLEGGGLLDGRCGHDVGRLRNDRSGRLGSTSHRGLGDLVRHPVDGGLLDGDG